MNRAYIAFGANLSNPRETLMQVVTKLGEAGVVIDRVSNLWASPAWPPGTGAPDYRNAVLAVGTMLEPEALMALLLDIETALGRVRTVRNAPRVCDLDLIDYAGRLSDNPRCILPHPRMARRDFVLRPLAEVAGPDWRHPVGGQSVEALLAALETIPA
ncbi:2-amino-4-hydroxy-6-hydroxymethyldihydropteridine diphosphokinase [uncultured Algimonas sp.]|uniref:2-amino-4-hydroxy-6- hydroxymethyldihydropteridine diphosphokinase n=1 Tax=uncultured Algimonas sp. TaxID=1547920 RepID=UPI002624C7A7|nr:2-amino-4-hydroxy-6-hydroxymethyldihydropteridine diphosphokinase [uncultured Algimonas sp.]